MGFRNEPTLPWTHVQPPTFSRIPSCKKEADSFRRILYIGKSTLGHFLLCPSFSISLPKSDGWLVLLRVPLFRSVSIETWRKTDEPFCAVPTSDPNNFQCNKGRLILWDIQATFKCCTHSWAMSCGGSSSGSWPLKPLQHEVGLCFVER